MAAAGADRADDGQDDVLRLQARRELAGDLDPERLGRGPLPEGLRGQDVLDLARPDPEGQGPEGAVGAGVAVAADDRQAGERQAQLGADHVDDPLMAAACMSYRVTPNSRQLARRASTCRRESGSRMSSWFSVGHVVVERGERQLRPADLAPGQAEPLEGLRARHLVDQVPIDLEQRRVLGGDHLVPFPDFLEQRLGHDRLPQRQRRLRTHVIDRAFDKSRTAPGSLR